MRGSHAHELKMVAPFVVRMCSAHLGDGPRNFDFLKTVTTNSKDFGRFMNIQEKISECVMGI